MVEVRNLLSKNKVLKKSGTPFAGSQAVLIRNGAASVACKVDVGIVDSELG
jgi:hypothetical protein